MSDIDSETYEKLALQLIREAIKNNKLDICIDKPSSNFLYLNEGGGTEISFSEMLYNHKTYMDRLKNDDDSSIFLMLKNE
tara:strand:- start:152 stop:391 length:240 start_codon:yes stop_codon:yes gene_type:complete